MICSKLKLIVILLVVMFLSTGCLGASKKNQAPAPKDAGIYKTSDNGTTWQHPVLISTVSGRPGNFALANYSSWAMDPSDNQALYYGAVGGGLLYSYNGGASWQKAKGLRNNSVKSVAVDPNDKCTIYVTIGNRVYKSIDCSRSWQQMYFDNQVNIQANTIVVNHQDSQNIYLGLSRGDLIESSDGGKSWQTINRFKKAVIKIIIDPNDSRIIYAILGTGVQRLGSDGVWQDFASGLKKNKLGTVVKDLVLIKDKPNEIYMSTSKGIIRSTDKGVNWEKIALIPPDKKADINGMAVNPLNTQEIYYITKTTFFRSKDGGSNWTPIKLPTTRTGWRLMIDPVQPKVIYLAVRIVQKK